MFTEKPKEQLPAFAMIITITKNQAVSQGGKTAFGFTKLPFDSQLKFLNLAMPLFKIMVRYKVTIPAWVLSRIN